MIAEEPAVASPMLGAKICYRKRVWSLAIHHSKANKQARLVEREVCLFQMLATRGRGE